MRKNRVERKNVLYKSPEIAGIFYYESMTYYQNANSPEAKVILIFPAPAGRRGG